MKRPNQLHQIAGVASVGTELTLPQCKAWLWWLLNAMESVCRCCPSRQSDGLTLGRWRALSIESAQCQADCPGRKVLATPCRNEFPNAERACLGIDDNVH